MSRILSTKYIIAVLFCLLMSAFCVSSAYATEILSEQDLTSASIDTGYEFAPTASSTADDFEVTPIGTKDTDYYELDGSTDDHTKSMRVAASIKWAPGFAFTNSSKDFQYGVKLGLTGYYFDADGNSQPIYTTVTYGEITQANQEVRFSRNGPGKDETLIGLCTSYTITGLSIATARISFYSDEACTKSLSGTDIKGYLPAVSMTANEYFSIALNETKTDKTTSKWTKILFSGKISNNRYDDAPVSKESTKAGYTDDSTIFTVSPVSSTVDSKGIFYFDTDDGYITFKFGYYKDSFNVGDKPQGYGMTEFTDTYSRNGAYEKYRIEDQLNSVPSWNTSGLLDDVVYSGKIGTAITLKGVTDDIRNSFKSHGYSFKETIYAPIDFDNKITYRQFTITNVFHPVTIHYMWKGASDSSYTELSLSALDAHDSSKTYTAKTISALLTENGKKQTTGYNLTAGYGMTNSASTVPTTFTSQIPDTAIKVNYSTCDDIYLWATENIATYKVHYMWASAANSSTYTDKYQDTITYGSSVDIRSYTDATLNITPTTKTGYSNTALGWTDAGNNASSKYSTSTYSINGKTSAFTMPAHDVYLYGTEQLTAGSVSYTVKYYQQDLSTDKTSATTTYTENTSLQEKLTATADTTVNATIKTITGYTHVTNTSSKESATVAGDGTTVLKVYYDRVPQNVSYSYTGTIPSTATALPSAKSYPYGASISVAENASATGYDFSGWSQTGTITIGTSPVSVTGSFIPHSHTLHYMYAPYGSNTYTELTSAQQAIKYDEKITVKSVSNAGATASTTPGYSFKFTGWTKTLTNSAKYSTDDFSSAGGSFTLADDSDVYLYATELRDSNSYTVHYMWKSVSDDEYVESAFDNVNCGESVNIRSISAANITLTSNTDNLVYQSSGWDENNENSEYESDDYPVSGMNNAFIMPAGDVWLYAREDSKGLDIVIEADKEQAHRGETIHYTIAVSSIGTLDYENTIVHNTWSEEFYEIGAAPSSVLIDGVTDDENIIFDGNQMTVSLGTLASSTKKVITYDLTIPDDSTINTVLSSRVSTDLPAINTTDVKILSDNKISATLVIDDITSNNEANIPCKLTVTENSENEIINNVSTRCYLDDTTKNYGYFISSVNKVTLDNVEVPYDISYETESNHNIAFTINIEGDIMPGSAITVDYTCNASNVPGGSITQLKNIALITEDYAEPVSVQASVESSFDWKVANDLINIPATGSSMPLVSIVVLFIVFELLMVAKKRSKK